MADVLFRDEGTIVQFKPETDEGKQWFEDYVQSEPWQWLGPWLGVDHRYADMLVEGIEEAGLELQMTN